MNRVWVYVGMIALVWVVNFAGASRPKVSFRIHVQTEGKDFSPKQAFPVQLVHPVETVIVSAIPELTESDIASFESWPSDDQGLALRVQFTRHGADALSNMTIQDEGRIMVVILNGRIIYAPIIDTVLGNGILTIPRGVLPAEIPELNDLVKKNAKN